MDEFEEVVAYCYHAREAEENAFGGWWDPEGEAVHAFEIEVNG